MQLGRQQYCFLYVADAVFLQMDRFWFDNNDNSVYAKWMENVLSSFLYLFIFESMKKNSNATLYA